VTLWVRNRDNGTHCAVTGGRIDPTHCHEDAGVPEGVVVGDWWMERDESGVIVKVVVEIAEEHAWRFVEREQVVSSDVKSIGWQESLFVEFNSGAVYEYFDVPETVYQEFLATPSKGKFVHQRIKGKFESARRA
jgi:hypothetical protein